MMKKFFRNNSLSLAMATLFLLFLIGQAIAGHREHNQDQQEHGNSSIPFTGYVVSGHFLESVFENWESEFLQMGLYILFTAFLYQKGSAESNDPDEPEEGETKVNPNDPHVPAPVRKGGWIEKVYEHSLSLAFLFLFAISFLGHAIAGRSHYNEEQLQHGQPAMSAMEYVSSSRFWFESFQNWQSEFLAVFAIVILTIWLREKGSSQSKEMTSPHKATAE